MQSVGEWMIKEVVKTSADKTALHAARTMKENKVGVLPVVDGEILAGIISESDIVRKIVAEELPANSTKVRDIMSRKLVTVETDTSVFSAMQVMESNNVRQTPVIKDGKLVGLITVRDIIANLANE